MFNHRGELFSRDPRFVVGLKQIQLGDFDRTRHGQPPDTDLLCAKRATDLGFQDAALSHAEGLAADLRLCSAPGEHGDTESPVSDE
jgi:hypothetical protein